MISYSTTKPNALDIGKNGRCLYHWDIEKEKVVDEDGTKSVRYKYQEVAVYAPLSANKILKAVISEIWDKDAEQKLINEYNASVLVSEDESAVERYKAFLEERATIKAQVEKACKTLGIN